MKKLCYNERMLLTQNPFAENNCSLFVKGGLCLNKLAAEKLLENHKAEPVCTF